MKKQFIFYVVALFIIAGVITSCIKEDNVDMENASITMTFSTRANLQVGNGDSQLADNEEMKTLRVIVARQNGDVVYNIKTEIQKEETSKTFIFNELTVKPEGENFDFYAIANEEGVHFKDGLDFTLENIMTFEQLQKLKEPGLVFELPKTGEFIPQTAFKSILVQPGENDNFTMNLDFMVAKLTLTVQNSTDVSQTINSIEWKNMNTSETSVFPLEELPNNEVNTMSIDNMTVAAGGSSTQSVYVFENKLFPDQSYAFSAQWNGQVKSVDLSAITNIQRGKNLNITATLIRKASEIDCNISVAEWIPWPEDGSGPSFE